MIGSAVAPRLVGREAELATLLDCAVNPPALVLVEGEEGMGKTRLVAELLDHADLGGRRRLVGRCPALVDPLPLSPIIEALRGAVVGVDRALSETPPTPEHLGERHLMFLRVLDALSTLGPSVLVLDDVHWSDELTAELIRFLVPQLPASLALVLTYRRKDLDPSSRLLTAASGCAHRVRTERVVLGPLSRDATGALATAILGPESVSPTFVAHLHRQSAGVPFLAKELVGTLRHRPDLTAAGPWLDWVPEISAVPAAVADRYVECLCQLGPDARRVVEVAAVVGTPATEALLIRVARLAPTKGAAALCEALREGLLVEGQDGYWFRHPLAAAAVYQAIPTPACRPLHLRVAEALDAPPRPVARLAYHYRLAGRQGAWLRYAEAAADLSAREGDDPAAADLLQSAVADGGARGPQRVRLALKLARASARGGTHLDRCVDALRRVIDEEALTAGTRGELRLFLGALTQRAGETTAGRAQLERSVAELRRRPALAAKAMAWLGRPDVPEVPLMEHLAWLERAVHLSTAPGVDAAARAAVLATRADVLVLVGDPGAPEAVDEIPWASELPADDPNLVWAATALAGAYIHTGDYERARSWLVDARQRVGESPRCSTPFDAANETHALLLDWATGRWEGLGERARRHVLRHDDSPRPAMTGLRIAAQLSLAQGELEEADRQLDRFFARAADVGVLPALISGGAGRARVDLARGDPGAAVEEAASWLRIVEGKGVWVWAADIAPVAVAALLASGRIPEAANLAARFAAGLALRSTPLARCALEACDAQLDEAAGKPAAAALGWDRASRAYAALPRPYDAAQAQARHGACLLAAGRGEGGEHLLAAWTAFERLGAGLDSGQVRVAMRAHAIAPPHTGGRRAYGTNLSPRERDVVRLAGHGLTDAQIAQTLGLSRRTVGHHVSAAMRKLGVSSRRMLPSTNGRGSQK